MCLVSLDRCNTRMHGFCDRSHSAGSGQAGRGGASWGSRLEVGRARASGLRRREVVAALWSALGWCGCPLQQGPRQDPRAGGGLGGSTGGTEAVRPGPQGSSSCHPLPTWFLDPWDWRGLLGSCCTPPSSTPWPVRWEEGPRAQIRQCLGQDYPADPTCHCMCGRPGPLWIACPVPSSRDSWLQSEQLSVVPGPPSPWPRSLGIFICGAQEAPAIWKLPEEPCFHSPGTGPGCAGLRRVVLEPSPCCPSA